MKNRRIFLAQAAVISAGFFIKPSILLAATERDVELQLYSLRDQLPNDIKSVIKKIAEAGYKGVETFGYDQQTGYWGLHAREFIQLLKDNGMRTSSGHYDFNQFFTNGSTKDINSYIEAAHFTGQEYIVIPALHEQLIQTESDFKKVAEKMNTAAELIKKEGLKLGYHNHNFEWKPTDGTTFYDTLLTNTDPSLVYLEMDVYFMLKAGQDPAAYFDKYKGRFMLVHIKDMDKNNPDKNTEVGKGSIDFKPIIDKAKAVGVSHFIVEQENFINIDPYLSIKESADYIKDILHL